LQEYLRIPHNRRLCEIRELRCVREESLMVEEEFAKVFAKIDAQMPHFDDMPSFSEIPPEGLDKTLVLTGLEKLTQKEQQRWLARQDRVR
jgi:hypothetical protein